MENKPKKGPGRPRKNPPVPNAVAEGASVPADVSGDGETGDGRVEAQAVDGGSGEVLDWAEFVAVIKAKHSLKHQIRTAWHPDPRSDLITTEQGNIRVLTGDSFYQINTAETFKI